MRATETGAAARARTAETCSPEVAAAAEMGAAAEVTATTKVTAAATDMTATAAEVAAAATTATAAATASLRRGSGTDQKDRENNGQDIEFRHGTLEARGLRREGLIWKPARANRAMVPKFPAVCGLFRGFAESELR
ncbi:MAG: hypothetical protein ACREC2_08500 [Bradyrhizobium sp.]